MSRNTAFTLPDALTILVMAVIAFVVYTLLLPIPDGHADLGRLTICGTRLNRIYSALNSYSVLNQEKFPLLGTSDPSSPAIGFRESDRQGGAVTLNDNVTAVLWVLARDASLSPKDFLCPSDRGAVEDPLTIDGAPTGASVALSATHDFSTANNLSFSIMNIYHPAFTPQWGPNTNADWVFMADDNNNNSSGRHLLAKGAAEPEVQLAENSLHHFIRSDKLPICQNVMYGDGHTSSANDPFQGPGGDNIYAMVKGGRNAPPTLGNSDGDAATDPQVAKSDVVLLPITGNGGGAGSLDPAD